MVARKNLPAKKSNGTAVSTNVMDRLAQYAKRAVETEASVSSGQFISVRAGQMQLNGTPLPNNEVDVIVLDAILENCLYEGEYDSENPQPPVCYAFGREDADMAPHEKSLKPQNETCKGCVHNEFGSAERGKGKACKNIRRLALIPAANSIAALEKSDLAFMKLPVTSVKGWATYVRQLAALEKRPPLGVVTKIKVVPDPKSQFKVTFAHEANLEDDEISAVLDRVEEAETAIMAAYPEPNEQAPKASKAAATRRRKY